MTHNKVDDVGFQVQHAIHFKLLHEISSENIKYFFQSPEVTKT